MLGEEEILKTQRRKQISGLVRRTSIHWGGRRVGKRDWTGKTEPTS